jgi:hypothetical protein
LDLMRARIDLNRSLLRQFGKLLEAWPQIFAAAKRLRERDWIGVRGRTSRSSDPFEPKG